MQEEDSTLKRKHGELSSVSDAETSLEANKIDGNITSDKPPKNSDKTYKKHLSKSVRKRQKAKKAKVDRQKNLRDMFDQMVSEHERPESENGDKDDKAEKGDKPEEVTMEQQLKEINEKLSHVVRKDDKSFLR